tara:strand:+ start:2827 stop:3036 length:210 start_codon:yes stop_codon:yes gene_type:complete
MTVPSPTATEPIPGILIYGFIAPEISLLEVSIFINFDGSSSPLTMSINTSLGTSLAFFLISDYFIAFLI